MGKLVFLKGFPKINSYNRNCNPNRKIFMTITHLCLQVAIMQNYEENFQRKKKN